MENINGIPVNECVFIKNRFDKTGKYAYAVYDSKKNYLKHVSIDEFESSGLDECIIISLSDGRTVVTDTEGNLLKIEGERVDSIEFRSWLKLERQKNKSLKILNHTTKNI